VKPNQQHQISQPKNPLAKEPTPEELTPITAPFDNALAGKLSDSKYMTLNGFSKWGFT
jgi:hypothetical protein